MPCQFSTKGALKNKQTEAIRGSIWAWREPKVQFPESCSL